jgi:uncharacterized surface protein with fasciclin (FAS1) repeats
MRKICLLFVLPAIAARAGEPPAQAGKDIVTTAVEAGQFGTLATALGKAGLVEALRGEGPFTVFAPTDAAFAKLPKGTVESLLEPANLDKLKGILLYHVVAGRNESGAVAKMGGAATLNGQRVAFTASPQDGVRVAGAKVVKADIRCSNGVIHVIDTVILPETRSLVEVAAGAGKFATLLAAAKAAGLAPTLAGEGPFTLFAPTDAAFAKLPKGTVENLLRPENREQLVEVLSCHVVKGRVYAADAVAAGKATSLQGGVLRIAGGKVQDANLIGTDINASNGVIHVIDAVLLPGGEG